MRNPKLILYAGDSGWPLYNALRIFAKARECDPSLELRVCRQPDKPSAPTDDPQVMYEHAMMLANSDKLMLQPGVSECDLSELEAEFSQAAMWLAPTHFPPQEAMAGMLAQLQGAIPVFTPTGALGTYIFAGIQIYGIATLDRMVRCRFAYEIVKLANDEALQESIRMPMMERARKTHWTLPHERLLEIVAGAENIQGWMTRAELIWLAEAAAKSESVVEIGSWKGRSTYALASACKGPVFAVDHWQGGKDEPEHIKAEAAATDLYGEFAKNVGKFKNLATIRSSSQEAAEKHLLGQYDAIFIDGGHSEDEVRADIQAWRPKARRLVCGHDYNWPSVKQAVDAELGPVERGPGSIWYKRLATESLANAAD